jgi:hypothetical protein
MNAQEMVTGLWGLANENPSKDMGNAGQKSAFKLLLEVEGGIGFIAKRPAEEVKVLGRRGVCSPNLRALMPQFAEVELQRRQIMRDLAGLERRMCKLLADARMVRNDT